MSDPREEIQEDAKKAWLESDQKNTIVLATGGGKSKVAIDLLKEMDLSEEDQILLLTNATPLRDHNWKVEFEKFGYDWNRVTSECYQTTKSWTGKHFKVCIADEIDFIAEGYAKVFENNTFDKIIGLTGFITEEKEEFLQSYAPVCFKAPTSQLQEAGALNKSKFIFIKFPLSIKKSIEKKTKKGGTFKVSENDEYRYWDKEFQLSMIAKASTERKLSLLGEHFENDDSWKKLDWKMKISSSKRKSVLHNSENSAALTNKLISLIHGEEGNKILVFSSLTKQCNKFPNPFHGALEDKNSPLLDRLNRGEINTLSSVKKISRGVNLEGVNWIIKESYDSSEVDFQQQHGRGLRLKPDQVLTVIVLLPFYEDMVKIESGAFRREKLPTQATRWAEKMMKSMSIEENKVITLDHNLNITMRDLCT